MRTTRAASHLKITKAGREAIGVDDDEAQNAASRSATRAKRKSSGSKKAGQPDAQKTSTAPNRARRNASEATETAPAEFRAGSKQAKIVDLLKRPKGATLDGMIEATDWLPHTTRAALTRLRKRGLTVERVKDEGRVFDSQQKADFWDKPQWP